MSNRQKQTETINMVDTESGGETQDTSLLRGTYSRPIKQPWDNTSLLGLHAAIINRLNYSEDGLSLFAVRVSLSNDIMPVRTVVVANWWHNSAKLNAINFLRCHDGDGERGGYYSVAPDAICEILTSEQLDNMTELAESIDNDALALIIYALTGYACLYIDKNNWQVGDKEGYLRIEVVALLIEGLYLNNYASRIVDDKEN